MNFFERLRAYYLKVAEVLRGEASAASIFPNTTDIGISRENIYANFLKQHAPSKCNVFLGGFVFDEEGLESKQLDVIITTDTAPRFNFHNHDGAGKSFSPVEGTLGVVSIKSHLNRNELFDALSGIASIPATRPLDGRVNPMIKIKNYDDWPTKVIYSSSGISPETLLKHVQDFYQTSPSIPINRRPNFIHVAGVALLARASPGMSLHDKATGEITALNEGEYFSVTADPDLQAIVWVLNSIQQNATASSHINFNYGSFINRVSGLP